jgi:hypothetical protein
MNRLNGWQRLWLVATALGFISFGLIYPFIETGRTYEGSFSYRSGIVADINGGRCAAYMRQPLARLSELGEPPFSADGGNCWHIYVHRSYSKVEAPFTLEAYDSYRTKERWQNYVIAVALFGGLWLVLCLIVYGAGLVVRWISRGFRGS